MLLSQRITKQAPVQETPEQSESEAELFPAPPPPTDGFPAPEAPQTVADTGLDEAVLTDLVLKIAYTVPQLTTSWTAQRTHLPLGVTSELLEQLRVDHMLEILGQSGPFGYRYSITQRGRERANRLLEISGYIGPAPVSLEAYIDMLERQMALLPPITPEQVASATGDLVLPGPAMMLAGLAVSSGRSLFVHGPPGNGKTSLGRLLHRAMPGEIWIPHCIGVDSNVIRLFDPHWHHRVHADGELPVTVDHRWIKIRRPMIVGGGELTIDSFDLNYSHALRYYEAPLHLKANGGLFLIDDFGRQRVDTRQLLNRWIIPLEHQIDHLTLHTGQSIQVPFRQMLIIATNLDPEDVMDEAFLRRMGYRLHLGKPTAQDYARIFERYAERAGIKAESALVALVLDRYKTEHRDLRSCEPRDLIERVRDISRFRAIPFELNEETMALAWMGYFGNRA